MWVRFKIKNCGNVKIYGRDVRDKTEDFPFPFFFRQGIKTKKKLSI